MLNFKKNNDGFSLIEIIISVALLSIIAATFLQIFSGSFERIMAYGRENIEHYEAGGELEIALRDENYTGDNENVTTTDSNILVFNQSVTTSFIQSKSKDLDTKLETGDQYIFAFAEKKGAYNNEAFIDINGNEIYDSGEAVVSSDALDGVYADYESTDGILVIPYSESLNDNITSIDWRIKDGIVIKRGVSINVTGDVYIDISAGDLVMNSIVFESQGYMDFTTDNGIIETQSSSIIAKGNLISFTCNDIYLNGFSSRVAIIDNSDINFYVDDNIYMNQYTFFYDDASIIYAKNNLDANLNIANNINNNEFN